MSIQGSGEHPTLPAQWFYGLWRDLPGRAGLVVTVVLADLRKNLTPASGRQDHTSLPYALMPFAYRHYQRPPPPVPRSRTIMIRPCAGRDGRDVAEILILVNRNIFESS